MARRACDTFLPRLPNEIELVGKLLGSHLLSCESSSDVEQSVSIAVVGHVGQATRSPTGTSFYVCSLSMASFICTSRGAQ
jgi:hypothetical protein